MGQCPFFRQAAEEEQEAAVRREEQFDKPAARAHSKVMKQPYNTSSQDDLVLMVSLDSITKIG